MQVSRGQPRDQMRRRSVIVSGFQFLVISMVVKRVSPTGNMLEVRQPRSNGRHLEL